MLRASQPEPLALGVFLPGGGGAWVGVWLVLVSGTPTWANVSFEPQIQ
jgi:hypothetical protein